MRRHALPVYFFLAAAVLLTTACGGNKEKEDDTFGMDKLTEAAESLEQAAEDFQQSFELKDRDPVTPVDYELLLPFLPDNIAMLDRGEPKGETTTYGNWKFSHVRAEYTEESREHSATFEIFDYAHISALYAPFVMLLKMNYNKKSTEGFERSEEFGTFPGYAEYRKAGGKGKATVLVGERFILTVKTTGLGEFGPREAIDMINLQELAEIGRD